ncbi:hypothetical protein ES319_D06G234900v1 [Gossypium barbadense]|uniref:Shikimate O-hydroxycinnamoyltransferase-like n=1 Tax=Gossypium barbadense TaxID=3634 RepID=A0A5J5R8M3_GOSBA|nr:hypothetical protein ES319_D06G234900v1 [Gossypium barbadense]
MEISIKESTMVRPAEEHTPKGSIWNSNLDLLISRYHVSTVYFYKPNGCSDFFDTGRVKEGLSKVLVPFYPIAGRLGYDENGRLEIICNDEGVPFVEAETSSVLEDLVGNGKPNYYTLRVGLDQRLCVVTKFKCGGVCLGVGFQHTLGDGTSAIHFINSWADTARGVSPAIAPFIDRTLLRARVRPMPKFHHIEYEPSPPLKAVESDLKPSTVSTFKLTVDQLNALKAKAAANSSGTKYSSYNILAAHIWRCVSKAMGLSDDQPTKMYFPVDARSKLNPPLPPGYFGNVIFINALITQAGDLNTESFLDTIKRIHEGLKQINDEYLRSALDYIETVSDSSTLVRGSHTFRCPNLIVNTWMRLPIYEADFGWGRPIHTGPADVVHEGIVYLLPTPINDGSLLLVARLEISHMSCFEKLLYEF